MRRARDYSILSLLPVLIFTAITTVSAQSAADQIALGNRDYDARNAPSALAHYEKALAKDSNNYVALWRAARAGVEVGEYTPDRAKQLAFYKTARQRALRAIKINPADAEGHAMLALALGRSTLAIEDIQQRGVFAADIHNQSLACLRINPKHATCLHAIGMWHAEIMRLDDMIRVMARSAPGGELYDEASWDEAQKDLVAAVNNEPRAIVHWLDLGRIYIDRGMKDEARTAFRNVLKGDLVYYNDPHYKTEAEEALHRL